MKNNKIRNGIYLVIDPSMDEKILLSRLKDLAKENIVAVQIWDNFAGCENPGSRIKEIACICRPAGIPLLINNRWDLLHSTELDGIHLDEIPLNFQQLKKDNSKEIITGITCNNDLAVVQWAEENSLDYISFCSMFPSSTANSCSLVTFETVKKACSITSIPLFLAGGIRPDNIETLDELNYSGIAVVSGIMNADKPVESLRLYEQKIKFRK